MQANILIDTAITKWTEKQTRDHLVNTTTEEMRHIMVNQHIPLKRWEDVAWYYSWYSS
jgi:hypothetical protein